MCPAHCSQAFHSSYWSTYRKGNLYFPKETSPFVILHLHGPCTPNHFPLQLPASLPLPQLSAAENGHGWFTSSSGWSKTPLHFPTQTPYFAWGGGGVMGIWLLFALRTHPIAQGYQLHAQGSCSACPGRESLKVSDLCDSKSKQTKLSEGEHLGTFSTLTITLQQFPCDFGYTLYRRDSVFSALPGHRDFVFKPKETGWGDGA